VKGPKTRGVGLGLALLSIGDFAGASIARAEPYRWEPSGIPFAAEGSIPLYGGLGSGDRGPKCRLADLDGDGDLDLYALDKDARIAAYRNDGGPLVPLLRPSGEDLLGLPITDWFLFADIDADLDFDLFGGVGPGGEAIALFRNEGTPSAPRFRYEPTAAFLDSAQVIPRLGNTPQFADLDGDGDLDLFYVMPDQGIGAFHGNLGSPSSPDFSRQYVPYGGLNTFVGGGLKALPMNATGAAEETERRHGSSFPTFFDIDGDDDFDLYIGDITNQNVWLFRNDGGADSAEFVLVTPASISLPSDTLCSLCVTAVWTELGDLDGDGLPDLLAIPSQDQGRLTRDLYRFQNNGIADSAAFVFAGDSLLAGIDLGVRSYPTLADLDGDADLDMVVSHLVEAGAPGLILFENVGTTAAPSYLRAAAPNPVDAIVHDSLDTPSPEFADMDGDGDLDAVVGQAGFNRQVFYFENQGTRFTASFSYQGTLLDPIRQNIRRRPDGYATPTAGDLDGDGDLDLLVGEFGSSGRPKIYFYRNVGLSGALRRGAPQFEWVSSNADTLFGFSTVADSITGYLSPSLVDVDGDSRLDIVIGSEDGRLREYRNVTSGDTARFARVPEAFVGIDVGRASVPAVADLDADGDLDLFVGEENGGINFYRNLAEGPGPKVSFAAALADTAIRVSWSVPGAAGASFTLLRSEENGAYGVASSGVSEADSVSILDRNGLFPGNVYTYRLTASFGGIVGDCCGPAEVFLPIPPVEFIRGEVEPADSGEVRVTWEVSRTFPGMAFRLTRRAEDSTFVAVAGAESLAAKSVSSFVTTAPDTATFRLEALYRHAGVLEAVPDSVFSAALITKSPVEPPVPFLFRAPRPNPSRRGEVTFALDLPAETEVRIDLFDLSGRRVRSIGPVRLASGIARSLVWDGKDDDGDELPAGVFVYRLRAGGRETSGRLTRIR